MWEHCESPSAAAWTVATTNNAGRPLVVPRRAEPARHDVAKECSPDIQGAATGGLLQIK